MNRVLESSLVLLDKDNFSMNACLDALEIPSREGVFMMPIFPLEFSRTTFRRETNMTRQFESDTMLQRRIKDIWAFFAKSPVQPLRPGQSDSLFASIRDDVAKIKSRGGDVMFVRTPSNEPMYSQEMALFPRDDYWERLLRETGCKGIHFKDFEPIQNLYCPELSHLSTSEKKVFTRHFAALLANEVGWTFPQMPPTPQQ